MRMKRAVTLIELLLAMVLMVSIVLAAVSFHILSSRMFTTTENVVEILNRMTLLVDHLHKNMLTVTGDRVSDGISVNATGGVHQLCLRQDMDVNGNENRTPQDYGDDREVCYVFNTNNADTVFATRTYPANSVTFEVFDDNGVIDDSRVLSHQLVDPDGLSIQKQNGGILISDLAMRKRPGHAEDPKSNPEVNLAEEYFYPFTHSWGQ
ncbi:MAG: hypothetical protein GF333_06220 [Candidatus Omnitrophica bacterium]|nr:hypothetical protein [Candidatus Omnitrophota bacterium]